MLVTRRAVAMGTLGLALTFAGSALADEAPSVEEIKAAENDFNRGREAYKQGLYTEAAEYFESADAHAPNDRVLELAIGARDKAGALDRAATLAQLGVDRSPNNDRMKKIAAPILDKAKTEFLIVVVNCNEVCNVIDGSRIVPGKPALKRTVYLPPGDHTIRAVWSDDRGLSQPANGKAGETATVDFKAPPIVKKAVPVVPTGPGEKKEEPWRGLPPLVFFIGAGATAALGGLTIWSGVDTVNSPGKDAVRENCVNADCELLKNGDKKELRTNLLLGGTAVVGVATAVVGVFLTDWKGAPKEDPKADTAKRFRLQPYVGYSNGPQLGAMGRF